jgi:ABC-type molybdate transport system ATPase subunit
MIEVKAGIHPDLTGRENVFMFGSLFGLKRTEVRRRFDQIVEFAELESSIDRQVKFYSSGMGMRLGFAVAAFLEPEILVVDEVLAVGDASFQQKCLERMREVMAGGTTLLYVSHDLATVEAMCRNALWLDWGRVRAHGLTRDVMADYRRHVEARAIEQRPTAGSAQVHLVGYDDGHGGPVLANGSLVLDVEVHAVEARQVRVVLGLTEGSASPVFLVERDVALVAERAAARCQIANVPLPAGQYALWATVLDQADRTIGSWSPVGHVRVEGVHLIAPPTGVVRLSPVVVDATWQDI